MAQRKGEWHTPISRLMCLREVNKKLEKCPHLEPLPKKVTFFNNPRNYKKVNMYDVAFNPPPGYNQRMHRDDRQQISIIHENIFQEVRSLTYN
ncbi:hypothetical protein L9F63_021015 [Diploptera punctata]|uniref:Uncharacterized protein n=1 Tax=Diploptera punctata TaxID=6984 RepID=A0AAD8ECE4_DIPPU|nr:hypothetical protein L9F63_021015 [Diploptera punctata]